MHLLMLLLIHRDAAPSSLFQVSARITNVLVRRRPVVDYNVVVVVIIWSSVLEQRWSTAVVHGGPLSSTLVSDQRHLAELMRRRSYRSMQQLNALYTRGLFFRATWIRQNTQCTVTLGGVNSVSQKSASKTSCTACTLTADASNLNIHNTNKPS